MVDLCASNTADGTMGEHESGVIRKPVSRYGGKTKEGRYMAADDALKAGYHHAGGMGNQPGCVRKHSAGGVIFSEESAASGSVEGVSEA